MKAPFPLVVVSLLTLGACGDGSSDSGARDGAIADRGSSPDRGVADSGDPDADGPDTPEHCDNGPLDAPILDCRPAPLPSTGDLAQDCVRRINQFRAECQCLPPLERWTEGEDCARQHAEYDSDDRPAHSGFSDRICENGGRAQNECPGYRSEESIVQTCLQQMWDEGPGEPFSEHGHYINMTNPAHTRVACGMHVREDGRVWAVQNFR